MLTLPGAASGTLGEPCQPRFLGLGQTPERVFLSLPRCGLWTHTATDPVLGRKMKKIPSQIEEMKQMLRCLGDQTQPSRGRGEKCGPGLFPAFGKNFQNPRG